jgi:ribonuclease HI
MISVYADGSSGQGGGKPGGWAFVVVVDDFVVHCDYGGDVLTTNNVMELTGCIRGLEAVVASGLQSLGHIIELVSDSQYALGMASGLWNATKNVALVEQLKKLVADNGVRLRWVRGHNGDVWNERCDSLAALGKKEATATLSLPSPGSEKTG